MKLDGQVVTGVLLGVRSSAVKTETIDESGTSMLRDDKGSVFLCPKEDQVIVGRMHIGDENGRTSYKYGSISFLNDDDNRYEFKLSDIAYSEYKKESEFDFACDDGALIVGREHVGDENGNTRYAYRKLYVREKGAGKDAKWILCKRTFPVKEGETVEAVYKCITKESSGKWAEVLRNFEDVIPEKTYYAPMFRRHHHGDENGNTDTYFTFMTFYSNCESKN